MASKSPLRLLFTAGRPCARRSTRATSSPIAAAPCASTHISPFSSSCQRAQPTDALSAHESSQPRWKSTPAAMVAPVRSRPKPRDNDFEVNEDPEKLDKVYIRMLGKDGDKMLTEEVKWLVVTHKSFDHGRRGFNDRLAFLGKRIVDLQTSLALLNAPRLSKEGQSAVGQHDDGRQPFVHPKLTGLENLSEESKSNVLDKRRLAGLAENYGLAKVMRWKPRKATNLQASGIEAVLSSGMYAIVGAIALEKGGEVANNTVRNIILKPLGLTV